MSSYSFIASSYWRGTLNIGDLRQFPTLEQAWNHAAKLLEIPEDRSKRFAPAVMIYLVSEDREPYCFKTKPCQRQIWNHPSQSFIENPNLDSQELMLQKAQKEFEVLKKKLSL